MLRSEWMSTELANSFIWHRSYRSFQLRKSANNQPPPADPLSLLYLSLPVSPSLFLSYALFSLLDPLPLFSLFSLSHSLMASLSSLLYCCAFALLLNSLTCPCSHANDHHVVSVESLLPKEVCTPSKVSDPSMLEVVHRHGPCSPLNPKHKPAHKQILMNDHIRVDWIHRKAAGAEFTTASKRGGSGSSSLEASNIPARSGSSFGAGNYIVSLGFGTPTVTQTVVFDTGSDVTWIQCQPCVSACYNQQEQLFDPTKSSTYVNISCSSPYCSALDQNGCSGSTCLYAVQYGDKSYTVGFFAQDTLTITPSDVIPNFRFGCGENNNGLFGRAAGLLGLGREQVSLVMQASQKFGGVFSYCLPASSSSTGYLSFGSESVASNAQFTPLLSQPFLPTFYFLNLQSIFVGGQKLALSPTLFSNAGVIIDSGTVITRLPPTAYAALSAAFRQGMKQYPTSPAFSIMDTCYDLRNYMTVSIPTVALQYQGVITSLDPNGILYAASPSQICLAFAANGKDTDMAIIGNTQQRRFNVVYDVSKKQIGFGPGGC